MNRTICLFAATLLTARCATVAHGRYQSVLVNSNPSGAAVHVDCGAPADAGVTPVTVRLRRSAQNCSLTLTNPGYSASTIPFQRVRSGLVYANVAPGVVAGGVIGAGAAIGSLNDTSNSDSAGNNGFAAGFVLGAGAGMLIDHATGAMYKQMPERVDATLTKTSP